MDYNDNNVYSPVDDDFTSEGSPDSSLSLWEEDVATLFNGDVFLDMAWLGELTPLPPQQPQQPLQPQPTAPITPAFQTYDNSFAVEQLVHGVAQEGRCLHIRITTTGMRCFQMILIPCMQKPW
jgi:hypothetical protein